MSGLIEKLFFLASFFIRFCMIESTCMEHPTHSFTFLKWNKNVSWVIDKASLFSSNDSVSRILNCYLIYKNVIKSNTSSNSFSSILFSCDCLLFASASSTILFFIFMQLVAIFTHQYRKAHFHFYSFFPLNMRS